MVRPILKTKLCEDLGIEYPIISAGMGPTLIGEPNGAPVELVVAVSEAGGLGVLGGAGFDLEELRAAIREIRSLTDKPFGVDLLLPKNLSALSTEGSDKKEHPLQDLLELLPKPHLDWLKKIQTEMGMPELDLMVKTDTVTMHPMEAVEVCIEEKVPFMTEAAHANGMKVLGLVGNAKNAGRVARSGVDYVVAQGHEGGGHTGRVGTMALLPQAIDAAAPTPVLGAGGIGDGRGVAAALAIGCIGVWVGTRFLATSEGGAMELCKAAILDSTDEGTRVSTLYTGKTSRANISRLHELWDSAGIDALPFPAQVLFASALLRGFVQTNRTEYIAGFAGQVSGLIKEIKPAKEVLMDMVEGAVDILGRQLPQRVTLK